MEIKILPPLPRDGNFSPPLKGGGAEMGQDFSLAPQGGAGMGLDFEDLPCPAPSRPHPVPHC